MKKLTASILFIVSAWASKAQPGFDSIKNVVEQYKGASNVVVPNIRQMVAAGLDSNKLATIRPVYHYAIQALNKKEVYAFDYDEEVKLAYIMGNYPFLLNHIRQLNRGTSPPYHRHLQTERQYLDPNGTDPLWTSVGKFLRLHFDAIRKELLENISVQPEDAKMLALYLRLYLYDAKTEAFNATSIEKETRNFFGEKYKGRYAFFVQHAILDEITPSKLHFFFEAGIGPVFRGRAFKELMPFSAGIQATTGVQFKRGMLEFSFQESGSKLRKPLPIKGETWNADSSMSLQGWAVTLGYLLVDYKRISLYPFSGVNMAWMSPQYNGPTQSKETRIQSSPGFTAGMALQYKWRNWAYHYSTRKGGDFYHYMGLRVAYTNRNFKSEQITGNAWSCTFSFMGDFGERIIFLPWSWFNGTRRGIYYHARKNG